MCIINNFKGAEKSYKTKRYQNMTNKNLKPQKRRLINKNQYIITENQVDNTHYVIFFSICQYIFITKNI